MTSSLPAVPAEALKLIWPRIFFHRLIFQPNLGFIYVIGRYVDRKDAVDLLRKIYQNFWCSGHNVITDKTTHWLTTD